MTSPLLPADPSSIAGHRLLARLGAGGMGVVYLGRTEPGGTLVAVKVIQAEYASEPDFRARFRREVEAARRVDSPWTVPVTGADADADNPWLATAFVPGPSLAEAVAACGPLPVRSVRVLGKMLARALSAVHSAGLVHRDVKPGNVLLAVQGPRVIDFGIARSAEDTAITSADMIVGTPGFLSPEQAEARGAETGPPSDIFSLGCLLAYAATGRPPFGTGVVDALLYRTVHDAPDLEGIGGELAGLLEACLAKDPADRPTADELDVRLIEDAPEGSVDWLPDDVVRMIAERSAEMLALPDIEPTRAEAPSAEVPPSEVPPSRRTFLLAAGGVVLVAGGGVGAWAALRDDGTPAAGSPARTRDRTIGVQADLSGPGKAAGRAQEQGARLAVEQFNSRSGKPFRLELRALDDGGSPDRAPAVAKRFTADSAVLAVLGPTDDATARAVLPVYDESLLPLLAVSPGAMDLPKAENRSFLSARPGDAIVSVPLGVHPAGELGSVRPGLLQDRTAGQYGWESVTIANAGMRHFGRVPYPRVVPANLDDFEPVIADMLKAGVDAFSYCGYAEGAARFARDLAVAGFTGPRIAPQAVLDPRFLQLAGDAAEGWVLSSSFVDPAAVPAAKAFTTAFRKRYGAPPGYFAAEAYDTVNLVLQQLVAHHGQSRSLPDRKTLVALLRKSRYQGITKQYAFKPEDGRFIAGGVFYHRVEGGRFRYVGPAPSAW
ncbi:serine/threonine protein kinase [Streptomyces lunaelactis]|uniref:Serine/threonine protein kinase n=1 Tax=Streptomyces lunaelactis TaxID=1535768 RepID=A0A2R4T6E0_9ACTN|nr:bifunctional serine/threonine-protein kinase/ABC transporter substrate-binding protein [Streptomyces lunaelactis]AVZ74700.1 serine/threonine protein kinase [Streptomyces lunaelactis]NUK86673.1 ABC transporter substrate-binding protein [Streptomyces lunaelactis]